jgi:hypothetical protein
VKRSGCRRDEVTMTRSRMMKKERSHKKDELKVERDELKVKRSSRMEKRC